MQSGDHGNDAADAAEPDWVPFAPSNSNGILVKEKLILENAN